MAGYFVFLQIIVTSFNWKSHFLIWRFLIIFDQSNYKISGNAVENLRFAKSKQVKLEKKLKESDRQYEKIAKNRITEESDEKIVLYTVLFDEKSFKLSTNLIILNKYVSSNRFFKQCSLN